MRYLLIVPIVYVAAVFETSLGGALSIGHVGPDLTALAAVVWLLIDGSPRAFLVAGAIGFASDLISPGRMGIAMAAFLLVGYAVCRLRVRLPVDRLPIQVAVSLLAVTMTSLVIGCLKWLLGDPSPGPAEVAVRSAGVGIYTAGVGIPLLMILGWIREPHRASGGV